LKIIVDPIYTTKLASRCSTFSALSNIIKGVLDCLPHSTAVFLIPNDKSRMEFDIAAQRRFEGYEDRILFYPIYYSSDRYRELWFLRDDRRNALHEFGGIHGDWDVLLTSRNSSFFYRALISQSSRVRKFLVLFENFPTLPFKATAMEGRSKEGSLKWIMSHARTLSNFLGFDRIYFDCVYDRKEVLKAAKAALSVAFVKRLEEISASGKPWLEEPDLSFPNTDDARRKFSEKGTFEALYIQRFTTTQKRGELALDVFSKLYSLKDKDGLDIEFSVYTPSAVKPSKARFFKNDSNFFFMDSLPKEEFLARLRRGHVFVSFSKEEGGPASVYEACANACIGVVYQARWAEHYLGYDYPFFVKTKPEAYALVKWIYYNRETAFDKWLDWYNSTFLNTTAKLPLLWKLLVNDIVKHFEKQDSVFSEKGINSFAERINAERDVFGDIVDILNPGAGKENLRLGGWPKETPFFMLPQRWVTHYCLRSCFGWKRDKIKPWVLHRPA